MALARYASRFWYPDASLAANLPIQVFPEGSNAFAPLFADAAGTVPLPNPGTTTDGTGQVAFWAQVGPHWLHLDTETFLIDVGLGQEQADLSTGVASGGDISPGPGPAQVTIAPMIGYVVDNTDPESVAPTVTIVDFPGAVVNLDAGALGRTVTWWSVDTAGVVHQQAQRPDPAAYRTSLVLGVSAFDTVAQLVMETQTFPTILPQPANAFVDLADSLGPFSVAGNELRPNGANLSLDKTAGVLFARGFGYVDSGVYSDSPNVVVSPALTATPLRMITQDDTEPTPGVSTVVDVGNFDVGGVVTPVPGGPNVSTVQRVYLFGNDTPGLRVAVQYGQDVYATPQDAVRALGANRRYVPSPVSRFGTLIGYLAVTRTCTDLSDPAQCTFVYAGKFATP